MAVLTGWDMVLLESALLVIVVIFAVVVHFQAGLFGEREHDA